MLPSHHGLHQQLLRQILLLSSRLPLPSSADLFAMETDMIPKFSSKDEEIDFWRTLSLEYKSRCVSFLTDHSDTRGGRDLILGLELGEVDAWFPSGSDVRI